MQFSLVQDELLNPNPKTELILSLKMCTLVTAKNLA